MSVIRTNLDPAIRESMYTAAVSKGFESVTSGWKRVPLVRGMGAPPGAVELRVAQEFDPQDPRVTASWLQDLGREMAHRLRSMTAQLSRDKNDIFEIAEEERIFTRTIEGPVTDPDYGKYFVFAAIIVFPALGFGLIESKSSP